MVTGWATCAFPDPTYVVHRATRYEAAQFRAHIGSLGIQANWQRGLTRHRIRANLFLIGGIKIGRHICRWMRAVLSGSYQPDGANMTSAAIRPLNGCNRCCR